MLNEISQKQENMYFNSIYQVQKAGKNKLVFGDVCLGGRTIKKSKKMICNKVGILITFVGDGRVIGRGGKESFQVPAAIHFLTWVLITWMWFCDKWSELYMSLP